MNSIVMPALGSDIAGEIADRCRVYREEFGLDVISDSGSGFIQLASAAVGGVLVTPALGRPVVAALASVPVVSVGRYAPRLWMLLADAPACAQTADELMFRLYMVGALPAFPPASIALPTPGDPRLVWLRAPEGHTRPAMPELVDVITEAATYPDRRQPSVFTGSRSEGNAV